MEVEDVRPETSGLQISQEIPTKRDAPTWSFEGIQLDPVNIRGGGCTASTLHASVDPANSKSEQSPLAADTDEQLAEKHSPSTTSQEKEEEEENNVHTSWPGWAELENDPENFTILLQEWGMRSLSVNEVYDVTDLLHLDPTSIFGLIFLSRYVSPDQSRADTPSQAPDTVTKQQPWFANQISKFSCGTVALMNILMNTSSADTGLSESLSDFRNNTKNMNAKNRGVALDNHEQFRNIHNSFCTKLDQYIVDTLLKEDFNKAKQKTQAQARNATKKRKRGGMTFTKKRKPKQTYDGDEENGFHFVAYVSAHGNVWKLDGMQADPGHVGPINQGQTWLDVAVGDVSLRLQEALDAGEECTMMSVTRSAGAYMISEDEKTRKQEDWAPFIETLLRIHAERGDLNEMLGLS